MARLCIHPRVRVCLYKWMGIKIGTNVFIGVDCFLDDHYPKMIEIGNNVTISFRVIMAAHDESKRKDSGKVAGFTHSSMSTVKKIRIEDGVYIGTGAILLPGVTIGKGAVIGAGAVVTKDIPPKVIAAGNPAKVLRPCDEVGG